MYFFWNCWGDKTRDYTSIFNNSRFLYSAIVTAEDTHTQNLLTKQEIFRDVFGSLCAIGNLINFQTRLTTNSKSSGLYFIVT